MNLQIKKAERYGYHILLDGNFFRYCKTYFELDETLKHLVKSKFKENAEGFI